MNKNLKRWVVPNWMLPFLPLLNNTGGTVTPEHAMNCDARACNLVINAPLALCCISVSSQVKLLLALRKQGLLKDQTTGAI